MKNDFPMRDDFILHVPYKQPGVIQCGNEDWMINLGPSVSKDRDFTDTLEMMRELKLFFFIFIAYNLKAIKVNLR